MLSYRDLVSGLKQINLDANAPVIAHASLSAFGEVRGGADALMGALLSQVGGLMAPVFTYNTMITPLEGPPDNGLTYGGGEDQNRMAEFYSPAMPADRLMGAAVQRELLLAAALSNDASPPPPSPGDRDAAP